MPIRKLARTLGELKRISRTLRPLRRRNPAEAAQVEEIVEAGLMDLDAVTSLPLSFVPRARSNRSIERTGSCRAWAELQQVPRVVGPDSTRSCLTAPALAAVRTLLRRRVLQQVAPTRPRRHHPKKRRSANMRG